jgi:hypothetical protein
LVRNPDFRQKAACISLREDFRVDRNGLDLRMSDDANLLGFTITTFLTCSASTAATDAALPVASTTTTSSLVSFFAKASRRWRRMSTRPSRLSLPSSQATASAKARWRLVGEDLEKRAHCPPTGAPTPMFHAPQGAHAVFQRRWPK